MNKVLTTIAAVASIATAVLSNSAHAGEVLDRVLATKTLTVATGADWGPAARLNDKHELVGYDVDVARGIAKSLGVDVKFVTPGWDVIVAGHWQGRYDMAACEMIPTKARLDVFDFPAIITWTQMVAVVHKDSKATKPADLNGKVIGMVSGGVYEAYANQTFTPSWEIAKPVEYYFKPGEVKITASSNIALDDLRLGDGVRLDAVLTDDVTARAAIESGYPLRILEQPLISTPGAIAIMPGDKEFSDKVAAAVEAMRGNGTLSELSMKWYGADRTLEE
ncbi:MULTISPECIES: transporter substrate-binding domain-containing protein [Rhizobium]|uniref:Transporter substrate-binding domain-containing protein n=1 Tax=Rhizobium aouanii TaxID=3118145 RepID=A0ABU8CIV5_9HYPH|nr:transporter substrate-binding domain-containing protein [Rhizobium acaciae]MCW1750217.1 transporter substrate-binding domain-containing protein [Rhizobium acaciae]